MIAKRRKYPVLSCSGSRFDPGTIAGECRYDAAAGDKAVQFFADALRHTTGPKAGTPFVLEPWQADVTRTLFGWKRPDGRRRFRRAYITVPRKNGKSTWAAGLALYVLFADGEAGAQCYCAATEREQASLVFNIAANMVKKNEDLAAVSTVLDTVKRIKYKDSFLRAIPANESSAHGFDIHCCIGDELHAWYGRAMYDVLITGTGARPQPLIIWITTAGFDRNSVCWSEYQYAKRVRDGAIEDQEYLPVIYEAGEEDDWTHPKVWQKANPNLGKSVYVDYLEKECQRAQEEPAYQNTFRRLHLNQWTSQKTRWIKIDDWRRCTHTSDDIPAGATVFAGLDLASTTDLTSWCLVQRQEGGGYRARWRFWIPEERMRQIERKDRVPYSQWVRDGWVTPIPGVRIDQDYIERAILKDADRYNIQLAGYDPWNAEGLSVRLDQQHGVPMCQVRQGFASLSAPCKEFEATVMAGTLDHGGNPVAEWMVENVEVQTDVNGNIRPVRPEHDTSARKIDGIVALIMGIGVALTAPEKRTSVYERRGPILV